MKNDIVYLEQILDAISKIKDFTNGLTHPQFLTDQKTQSAVILQLALIGELSKRISKDTQSQIALPWKDIAGFRDRAIHDYYEIDLEIVWLTTVEDLITLEVAINNYLNNARLKPRS